LTYAAGLLAAMSYGVTFVLPLYVTSLGGTEADAGRTLFAGAVGTLLCVPFVGYAADRFSAHRVAAVASVLFGVGMLGLSIISEMGPALYASGFLLGCGWGMFFTSTPMVVNRFTDESRRSFLFSVLSGFQMIGIGGGPVLARVLLDTGAGFSALFLTAAVANLVATLLLVLIPGLRDRSGAGSQGRHLADHGLDAVLCLLSGLALYPIVMVFLGACIFSSMFNFQTTYAEQEGLNYTVFYVAYTVVVIAARFAIAGPVGRMRRDLSTIGLLVLMSFAIGGFLLVGASNVVYGVAAALLGLGYGLVYPLIQAQAVSAVSPEQHTLVLTIFSVSYFTGIFAFPLVSGMVIVTLGYTAMLAVLLVLAVLETTVAVVRALNSRSSYGLKLADPKGESRREDKVREARRSES
jgi:MFS family permease